MTAVGAIRSIVFDCEQPEPVATFWSQVLERPVDIREEDWWSLLPAPGAPRMAFQVVANHVPPVWPGSHGEQQAHLDIEVDDLNEAATRVLALGAMPLSGVIDDGGDLWQVFVDPAGHPFCLVPRD